MKIRVPLTGQLTAGGLDLFFGCTALQTQQLVVVLKFHGHINDSSKSSLDTRGTALRKLLNAYQEHFGVLLPTAGTVLDMGRTLTHKTIVVEMAPEGMSTQQIARRIFHTPEAVDHYLRLFDRVLVPQFYGLPPNLMRQVTGHSLAMINEHLALADKHFPNEQSLVDHLTSRGVDIQKAQ